MERTCENCKYSCVDSAIAAVFCMGQKNMPRVRPFDTCKDWKSMRITNADKYFRNATDEEIARLIVDDWCELINCDCQIDRALHWTCDGKCEERVLEWLKQEVNADESIHP